MSQTTSRLCTQDLTFIKVSQSVIQRGITTLYENAAECYPTFMINNLKPQQ